MKKMRLRYAGACRLCGASRPVGTEAIYESETKTVQCLECATGTPETTPHVERAVDNSLSTESGIAGSSARREYERRKAKDEEKRREKWGPFGGIAVVLSDERQSTKAWDRGAIVCRRACTAYSSLTVRSLTRSISISRCASDSTAKRMRWIGRGSTLGKSS